MFKIISGQQVFDAIFSSLQQLINLKQSHGKISIIRLLIENDSLFKGTFKNLSIIIIVVCIHWKHVMILFDNILSKIE